MSEFNCVLGIIVLVASVLSVDGQLSGLYGKYFFMLCNDKYILFIHYHRLRDFVPPPAHTQMRVKKYVLYIVFTIINT